MPIPATGPISLGMLQNEFRGTSPSRMGEYFRNNVLVKDIAENGNVPNTFRAISLSNFRGASYTRGFGVEYIGGGGIPTGGGDVPMAAASAADPRRMIVVVHSVARDNTGNITPGPAVINGVTGNRILGTFSTVADDGQGIAVTIARVTTGTVPTINLPGGPWSYSAAGAFAVYGHNFPVVDIQFRLNQDGGDNNINGTSIPIATPAGTAVMYIAQNNGGGGPGNAPISQSNFYVNSGIGVDWDYDPTPGTTTYNYIGNTRPAFLGAISFYKEF
jgi:hypothetical protein